MSKNLLLYNNNMHKIISTIIKIKKKYNNIIINNPAILAIRYLAIPRLPPVYY
jgi:hypothetical protein